MRLDRYRRATDFLADAGAWLTEREAEHNLILGIASGLEDDETSASGEPLYLALVRDGPRPVAAALRTPPWNLLLSEVDDLSALGVLADDLAGPELPGVTGPPDAVRRFAAAWTAANAGRSEVTMEEGVYRLTRVIPPTVVGEARRAAEADRPLLLDWLTAFAREALPGGDDEARMRDIVEGWDPEGQRQYWLWEVDGRPASVVGAGSRTPNGVRIGPVYTPPEERGHGYASGLTAAASQWNLDQGRRFCFLYTNLANATANHIYQAIGYERVTDALMVRFTAG
jgi:predicted GNAT family acetyltransferase